jgi:formate/nitrite transporter FocA (FNT family)
VARRGTVYDLARLWVGTLVANLAGGWLFTGMIVLAFPDLEQGTDSVPARLLAVVATAFLLGAGPLNHVIVSSLEAFAALQVGAPFGYLDWLGAMGFAGLGNLIGGIGPVTLLRLVQAGGRAVAMVRE